MMLQALIYSCKFMQINVNSKWPTGQGLKAFMLWTSKMLNKKENASKLHGVSLVMLTS